MPKNHVGYGEAIIFLKMSQMHIIEFAKVLKCGEEKVLDLSK
jgi:hypothetical protein